MAKIRQVHLSALKLLYFAYFLSNYQMKKQIGIEIYENLVCS